MEVIYEPCAFIQANILAAGRGLAAEQALCAMNTIDLQRYPENYELLSTDAALRAEQIACRMRHLVYGFTTVQKHEYLTSAANVLGITITAQPGLVEITLPGLLPKKKQRSGRISDRPAGAGARTVC